jgi:hypothetical protein
LSNALPIFLMATSSRVSAFTAALKEIKKPHLPSHRWLQTEIKSHTTKSQNTFTLHQKSQFFELQQLIKKIYFSCNKYSIAQKLRNSLAPAFHGLHQVSKSKLVSSGILQKSTHF